MPKRESWSEDDVLELPQGEHDFFERKSGEVLLQSNWSDVLSKAVSAFANSGGGHILLGVQDNGNIDGVPQLKKGRQSTRDWLEHVVPNLVNYRLDDFRVHEVIPSPQSKIPPNKVVCVIDVGDSSLAPHQVAGTSGVYYYRSAGRSVPAPHFYLETLRNRLSSPTLQPGLDTLTLEEAYTYEDGVFLEFSLNFSIRNIGRLAAYKWALVIEAINQIERPDDMRWAFNDFPKGKRGRSSGIPMETTILPGLHRDEKRDFGIHLHPCRPILEDMQAQLEYRFTPSASLQFKAVSEFSPGTPISALLRPHLLKEEILTKAILLLQKEAQIAAN